MNKATDYLHHFSSIFETRAGISHLFAGALIVFNADESRILGNNKSIKAIMLRAGRDGKVLAMDAFGGLYVYANGVVKIDPETAEVIQQFASIGESATFIEANARVETGWPLWLDWVDRHGAIEWPMHLVPIIPFVLGGEFGVTNLKATSWKDAFDGYDRLSSKLNGLQDGDKVLLDKVLLD
jgi:hypothetical protein